MFSAKKAFFGHVPFPVINIDTGKKMPEMYAFRDTYGEKWRLDLVVVPCPSIETIDPMLPPATRSAARKTAALKQIVAERQFDGVIAGIRRDEEGTRAKERVFSARDQWALGLPRSAAGILGPVQHRIPIWDSRSDPSPAALDRARHLPDADQMQPGAVFQHVLGALRDCSKNTRKTDSSICSGEIRE